MRESSFVCRVVLFGEDCNFVEELQMLVGPESIFDFFQEKMLLFVVFTKADTFHLSELLLQVVHFRQYPMTDHLHVVHIFQLEVLELLYLLLHQVVPLFGGTTMEGSYELFQQLVQTPSQLPHWRSPTHHPLIDPSSGARLFLCRSSLSLNLSSLRCNYLGNRHKQVSRLIQATSNRLESVLSTFISKLDAVLLFVRCVGMNDAVGESVQF